MKSSRTYRASNWSLAGSAILLVFLWQWATVSANYGGHWSALYCTGSQQRHPPLVASERIYLFPNSTGYDGQFYHYMAHDPWLRAGLKDYIDDARLRYRRILVPMAAYGLALGHSPWVDGAYEIVFLFGIGLGVYWSCGLARRAGLRAAWGLIFLLLPAALVSMDRLVVDSALAALTAGLLYFAEAPSWKTFLILAAAALTRETGLLLVAAYLLHLAWQREFWLSAIFGTSAAPALLWYGYVHSQTPAAGYHGSLIPLSAILHALANPWQYPAGTPFAALVGAADYVALAGVLLAFGLAIYWFLRLPSDSVRILCLLFAAAGIVAQRNDYWENIYDYGRVYSPLLLGLAVLAAQRRNPWLLAPVAMMLPRVAMQLAPQALGVARWLM